MAFWVWIVVAIVFGLIVLELYSWFKRKTSPVPEMGPGEGPEAELARAKMKIAILESRTEETKSAMEEEITKLRERYRQRLAKTEAAYQRQMVALHERLLGENESAEAEGGEPPEYEVRLASAVDAWLEQLEGKPAAEESEADDGKDTGAGEAKENEQLETEIINDPAGAEALAGDLEQDAALAELEAYEDEERVVAEPSEEVILLEAGAGDSAVLEEGFDEEDFEDAVVEVELAEAVRILDAPADDVQDEQNEAVAAQIQLLDETANAPQVDEELAAMAAMSAGVAVVVDYDGGRKVLEDDAGEAQPDEVQTGIEGRWPDREESAQKRVMVRRLASEMDADYIDDEELLRELGIGQEQFESDTAESEAGIELPAGGGEHDQTAVGQETGEANAGQVEMVGEDPVFDGSPDPEKEAAIAAAAAAIFARVADQDMSDGDEPSGLDDAPGRGEELADDYGAIEAELEAVEEEASTENETEGDALETAVVEDGGEGDEPPVFGAVENEDAGEELVPEPPAFTWERRPIIWEGEYYANTKLADEPAVVRRDKEIDFAWGEKEPVQGVPAGAFSVRWSGVLNLEPGDYRFMAAAPDGLRLWLNDRLMISAWYDQSEQAYSRDVAWRGGPIYVRLEHYENGGDAKTSFTWDRIA